MADVTFIIPAYNEEATIRKCLDSIHSQSFDGDVEILVVDDGSTDSTQEIAEEHADRVLVNEENGGLAYSLNKGIYATESRYVAMIQADCVLPDDSWLNRMHNLLTNDEDIAMLASWPVIPEEVFEEYTVPARLMYGKDNEKEVEVSYEKDALFDPIKANICRREALKEVDGFDDKGYVTAGEDLDLCLRLRRAGYRVDRADTRVHHLHGQKEFTRQELFKKKYQYSEAQGVLKRRYFSEHRMGVWNEASKGAFYTSFLIPPINFVTIPLFLVYLSAFTYSYRTVVNRKEIASAVRLKIISDLYNIVGFTKGFLTAKQENRARR